MILSSILSCNLSCVLFSILDYRWVQRLLGVSSQPGSSLQGRHLAFAVPWPTTVLMIAMPLVAAWFFYNYWRDGTKPTWFTKGPLVLLRLIALTALIMMLAQPVLRLTNSDNVRPTVAIMVDTSGSMAQPDRRLPAGRAALESQATGGDANTVGQLTRLARVNAALNHSGVLKELAKRFNVRLWTFAGKAHETSIPANVASSYKFGIVPDTVTGGSTQLGGALHQPIEELAGQPMAGALVLSDGGNNLGEDPVLVAETARQSGLPVSTVGIGDPTKTKDVALLSVLADDRVRIHNTVYVYADISQRGYAGKTIAVTLQRGNQTIGRQMLRLGADDQKQEVRFDFTPAEGGRFAYTVTAQALPGETSVDNNKKAFVQDVISKKLKVLYVENTPRYEFRYLKNAILRDNSLDFACLLLSGDDAAQGGEGNFPIHEFPRTEKELFEYDIVVIGDVPRSYFSDTQLQALRRFVEDRGASMLIIAGEEHMPYEYAGTPLEAVMPVVFSSSPDPVYTDAPFQWQLTPEGRRSSIMQLEDSPGDEDRTWANLPGMYWAAGVQRAKPGATVLAVHSSRRNADGPYPIVATQPFGAGYCYMELVDSTWRWRWRVGDRYFYRYWGQVFRTLTPKELPGNSRFVQLNADRKSYLLGDRAALSARLLDAYYHPIKAETASATITGEGGQQQHVTLQATPGSPGLYSAQIQPDRVGHYEVNLVSPVNPQAKASTAFVVENQPLEQQKPELDEALLKRVAAAGGGHYYQPTELLAWARSLPDHPLVVRKEQEIELFDKPAFLLLFIVPLSLEWLVRKRKGLL